MMGVNMFRAASLTALSAAMAFGGSAIAGPENPPLDRVVGLYEKAVGDRETTRNTKLDEAWAELDEHLVEAEKLTGADQARQRDHEISEAARVLVELDLLLGEPRRGELERDLRFRRTVATVEEAAEAAEERSDWLLASEMYVRLNALFESDKRYEEDAERLGRRLAMIRLYAPERLWDLTNERRLLREDEPLPPYNPFGDRFEDKLAPVTSRMIIQAVSQADFRHVEDASIGEMLRSGLDAIETFATTTDLAEVFEGLGSDRARAEFLGGIDALRKRLGERGHRISRRDISFTIENLLEINEATVEVMDEAVLHEFGNGAFTGLDRYTAIIWPDEIKRFERSTRGQFTGVGIQIEMDDLFNIKVVTPLPGSPAQKAGVGAGDIITKVNGRSTVGFTLDQAVEVITGPKGTTVDVTFERGEEQEDREEFTYTLSRTPIDLPTVKGWRKTGPGDNEWEWMVDQDAGIGYVRITGFSENTTDAFDTAVREMRRQGLSSLILDLRFNPGGLLDQAVSIANRFVSDGLIVKTEDRHGRVTQSEYARPLPANRSLRDIPVAVLINEGSASASEIVSGSIQAYAREGKIDAWVVGENSFGKGSVQQVFPLDARGRSMMKLTTQYYKLRDDRLIHRKPGSELWGVAPDIEIEMLPDQIVEAARLKRDADIFELDSAGNIIDDGDRPDVDDLINEGIDLQLHAALVKLFEEQSGVTVSALDEPRR